MPKLLLFLLLPLCTLPAKAQSEAAFPQQYFRSPLGIPITLSANFGEVRPDHFHMGLDIRTQQRENLPVYAAASGFITRISIQQYGYGKAIYIRHPNGYTTVYGHLNRFYDTLEHYIKDKQYNDHEWEQDFSFPDGLFPVEKGQFIAYSGNTGSSGGPHLHFEIRDTRTGNNLNPLLFGLGVYDNVPPVIHNLYWYDRRYSTYQASPQRITIVNRKGDYAVAGSDTVKIGSDRISFGIRAEDRTPPSPFLAGIYEAGIWMDDSLRCYFQLNNFSYTDSRYVNASIDYSAYHANGLGIQHLSRLPGNELNMYTTDDNNGVITLNDTLPHRIRVLVKDVAGNTSFIQFVARYDNSLRQNLFFTMNSILMPPGRPAHIEGENVKADFTNFSFYDTVPFVLGEQPPASWPVASATALLHNASVPVHEAYTVQLPLNKDIPATYYDRVVMQLQSGRVRLLKKPVTSVNGWYQSTFNRLGNARLIIDTLSPAITPTGWKDGQTFRNQTSLRIRCSDNLDDVQYFSATLDGEWLLFTHSTNDYMYTFDEHCSIGDHILTVSVQDIAGNRTIREFHFKKEPNGNSRRK